MVLFSWPVKVHKSAFTHTGGRGYHARRHLLIRSVDHSYTHSHTDGKAPRSIMSCILVQCLAQGYFDVQTAGTRHWNTDHLIGGWLLYLCSYSCSNISFECNRTACGGRSHIILRNDPVITLVCVKCLCLFIKGETNWRNEAVGDMAPGVTHYLVWSCLFPFISCQLFPVLLEILEEIFLHLPPDQVVCVCRLVCYQWKEVADSESLWRERCRREGYLLHDGSRTPQDWRLFYFLCKKRRNLLKNPRGERKKRQE